MGAINYKRVAVKGEEPLYTSYGYVITEDGVIYSLTHQYTHGTLLAILFPEVAKDKGYEPPDEDYCVYHYQRFELDNQDLFPIVRVSMYSWSGMLNISKGKGPITEGQQLALSKIFKEMGVSLNMEVSTELGTMSASSALKALAQTREEYAECL